MKKSAKWWQNFLGGNGRGLYGKMRDEPRNPGKKEFEIPSYGSRVIGQNVKTFKTAVIAPP